MKNSNLSQFLKHALYAFITVVITVHAFVFYSLYVVNGGTFMSGTGESSVIAAISAMGGVPAFGVNLPIWAVILTEFAFAYTMEMVLGSPASEKLAAKVFKKHENVHPVLRECAVICATVGIMCPAMSLIAAAIYYPYAVMPFDFLKFIAEWLKLVCFNFPFAFFSQLFFIQPLVRQIFKWLFYRKPKSVGAEQSKAAVSGEDGETDGGKDAA